MYIVPEEFAVQVMLPTEQRWFSQNARGLKISKDVRVKCKETVLNVDSLIRTPFSVSLY